MSRLLDAIDLDAASAHVDHGRRSLAWSAPVAGEIHRNRYEMAWFDVTEQRPMRGEPLWFSAQRRAGETTVRTSFTDAAVKAMRAELLPILARDFAARWEAASRRKAASATAWRAAAERARAEAAWLSDAADLQDMWAEGLLEIQESADHSTGFMARPVQVQVPGYRGTDYVDRVADAYLDGELVGHLTGRGMVPARRLPA